MKRPIYMDYAATTPCDQRVVEKMLPYFTQDFGNASSSDHPYGWLAKEAIDHARRQVADLIHAKAQDIIFTSGATESINLAIKGLIEYSTKKKQIITIKAEHSAVLDTLAYLGKKGYQITFIDLDSQGLLDLNQLENMISENTALISIQYANNETGVIQPIEQISQIAKKYRIPFFCDATQAVGKIPVDVVLEGIDILAFSSHKIYGPKGVGALYIQPNLRQALQAQQHGGKQELGKRSGTLNVTGIVGFGEAARLCKKELCSSNQRLTAFRKDIEQQLLKAIPDILINGNQTDRLPHIINFYKPGVNAEHLLLKVSAKLAMSRGSACSSAQRIPSHVLLAMNLNESIAHDSLRLSLGRMTSQDEVEQTLAILIHELA